MIVSSKALMTSSDYTCEELFSLRRDLGGLRESIREAISQDPSLAEDLMTLELDDWLERFMLALQSHIPESDLLDIFSENLQEILMGPVMKWTLPSGEVRYIRSPLEEISYRLNDGQTIGGNTFLVCLSQEPRTSRRRPSFFLNPDGPMIVTRHFVVEAAVKWLRIKERTLPSDPPCKEEMYEQLRLARKLPAIPTPQRVAMQEEARELAEEEQQEIQAFTAILREGLDATAREAAERIDAVFAGVMEQIQQINTNEQERLTAIQRRDVQTLEHVNQNLAEWDREIEETEERLNGLRDQLEDINNHLTQAEKDTIKLKIEKEEARKAIAKRKKRERAQMWKTAACVIACVVVAVALPQLAPEFAEMFTLVPVGGAGVEVTIALQPALGVPAFLAVDAINRENRRAADRRA